MRHTKPIPTLDAQIAFRVTLAEKNEFERLAAERGQRSSAVLRAYLVAWNRRQAAITRSIIKEETT